MEEFSRKRPLEEMENPFRQELTKWNKKDLHQEATKRGLNSDVKKEELIQLILHDIKDEKFSTLQFERWTVTALRTQVKVISSKKQPQELPNSKIYNMGRKAAITFLKNNLSALTNPASPPKRTKSSNNPSSPNVVEGKKEESGKSEQTDQVNDENVKPTAGVNNSSSPQQSSNNVTPTKFTSPTGFETPRAPTTPKSCLRTPKGAGLDSVRRNLFSEEKKPKSVIWTEVEVRQYNRYFGGSCGVPDKGGYALGLDWTHDEDNTLRRNVSDYEDQRNLELRRTTENIERIPEEKRKEILHKVHSINEPDSPISKSKIQAHISNLTEIRKSRQHIGCACNGSKSGKTTCASNRCDCFKNGIECNEDSCNCTNCKNPNRHTFNDARVNSFRKQKLIEVNSPTSKKQTQ